jgi:outer membrane biosynthesis protein TonB
MNITLTDEKKITHEEIARYAYLLWEEDGKPEGRDVDYWVKAEELLYQAAEQGLAAPEVPKSAPEQVKTAPAAAESIKPVVKKPVEAPSRKANTVESKTAPSPKTAKVAKAPKTKETTPKAPTAKAAKPKATKKKAASKRAKKSSSAGK